MSRPAICNIHVESQRVETKGESEFNKYQEGHRNVVEVLVANGLALLLEVHNEAGQQVHMVVQSVCREQECSASTVQQCATELTFLFCQLVALAHNAVHELVQDLAVGLELLLQTDVQQTVTTGRERQEYHKQRAYRCSFQWGLKKRVMVMCCAESKALLNGGSSGLSRLQKQREVSTTPAKRKRAHHPTRMPNASSAMESRV